jgi:anti-sigma regulatory factor (Ser/Thr protein kinase)
MTATVEPAGASAPFLHEAFFYRDDDEYLAGTLVFIHDGLRADEPILVTVPADRLDLLRGHLSNDDQARIAFAAMEDLGRNPAWIIPAWADFVQPLAEAGRPGRGIGEPVWFGRTEDELIECGRHEALLNLAFAGNTGFTLMCPYDATRLDRVVIDEAHRNHPHVGRPGACCPNERYEPDIPPMLDGPLSTPPPDALALRFDGRSLDAVRRHVECACECAGMERHRLHDMVVSASEAASNSIRHGGGSGTLLTWRDAATFYCQISDQGRIADPLTGRIRPSLDQITGRGMWIMHQLCDLVQLRSLTAGQIVRLHVAL